MKKLLIIFSAFLLINTIGNKRLSAGRNENTIKKTIKVAFNAVKFGKYDLAINQLNLKEMSKILMKNSWGKMSAEEQQNLIKGITRYLKLSLKDTKKKYKHFSSILYGKPRIRNNRARCKTTVIIFRNYKKKEYKFDFSLMKKNNNWKIIDVYILGEGTLEGIYEDEIVPIIKKGGIQAVMEALQKKIAEVSK